MVAATMEVTPADDDQEASVHARPDDRAVLDKAFVLLATVHDAGAGGIGVSALARATGLPKSTAFRLLTMLERNGAVEKVGTEYHVGTALRRIARDDEAERLDVVRNVLTPYLVDLVAATGGSVHLSTLQNDQVLYLTRIHGHDAPATRVRVGHVAPAHCTAAGKALLAHDPAASARVLGGELERRTERTLVHPAALRGDLRRTLARGVALERGEAIDGLGCIAVTLGGAPSQPRVAISVATAGDTVLRHADLLRRVRLEAERALQLARVRGLERASA